MSTAKHHSSALGSMRGVAALGVVGWHAFLMFQVTALENAYQQNPDFSSLWAGLTHLAFAFFNGPAYVTLFFVLSGTVLAMSVQRRPVRQAGSLLNYWLRRGSRLYPLLIFMASVGALLQLLYFPPGRLPGASDYMDHHYKVPAPDLLREWAFNAIGYKSSLNNPAWSIKVELLASLGFPLIMAAVWTRRGATLALAVSVAAMFLLPGNPVTYAYMNVFAACFVLGAAIPFHGADFGRRFHAMPSAAKAASVLAMMVVLLFSRRLLAPDEFAPAIAVLPESIAAAGLITVALFDRARAIYSSRVLARLGELSYSVYLVHVPVLFVIAHTFLPAGPLDPASAFIASAALALATIAVTLPLAWATYNFIEKPAQQLAHVSIRRASARFA